MARIHLKTQFSVGSDLFWKTQLSFYFNLFWKTQKIDRTLLAGISSNCFCSWKFEGSNLPKEARSQIWDGDLNIWNNKSHLSLYLINSISIFLDIWTYKKTHMHDQMAFTHGTIYIQNVTRFFVILLALTVDNSLVRRLPVGSACALPPVSLLTWDVNNRASKIPNKPCLHLNGNSPCSNAHLVEHKSSYCSWHKMRQHKANKNVVEFCIRFP